MMIRLGVQGEMNANIKCFGGLAFLVAVILVQYLIVGQNQTAL